MIGRGPARAAFRLSRSVYYRADIRAIFRRRDRTYLLATPLPPTPQLRSATGRMGSRKEHRAEGRRSGEHFERNTTWPDSPRLQKRVVFVLFVLVTFLGRVFGHLGAILGHVGAILHHLGAIMGHLGAILGPFWALLEPPWGLLGTILGHLGAILGKWRPKIANNSKKRVLLCVFVRTQEAFRRQHISNIGAILVPSWAHLGPSGGHRGATLGLSWAILGHRGPLEAQDSKHMQKPIVFTCFWAPGAGGESLRPGIESAGRPHRGGRRGPYPS